MQKHIVLTDHIVDHLNTVVSARWKKLSEEDRKIFTDVAQEAAAKATAEIKTNEAKLVDFFKQKGDRDRGQQGRVPRHRAQDREF